MSKYIASEQSKFIIFQINCYCFAIYFLFKKNKPYLKLNPIFLPNIFKIFLNNIHLDLLKHLIFKYLNLTKNNHFESNFHYRNCIAIFLFICIYSEIYLNGLLENASKFKYKNESVNSAKLFDLISHIAIIYRENAHHTFVQFFFRRARRRRRHGIRRHFTN